MSTEPTDKDWSDFAAWAERDKLDAARYRFLRDADRSDEHLPYQALLAYAGESLDAAIDAAMAKEAACPAPVEPTHCPWCGSPTSVADEAYCANADCRWNNGGTEPAASPAAQPNPALQELAHSIKRLGLEIFDGPECPQSGRDAIEWFAAELSVSQLPDSEPQKGGA